MALLLLLLLLLALLLLLLERRLEGILDETGGSHGPGRERTLRPHAG
jgi:hypothetical protein